MRLKIFSFLILFLFNSQFSFAQITYTEFDWQVLSWIRKTRLGLLVDIEIHEYKKRNYDYYNTQCSCIIDGNGLQKSLDTLINNAKYDFVNYIYSEMQAVVPSEELSYYDLAAKWNNKLEELEGIFLESKPKLLGEAGYISKDDLKNISLGRTGSKFRNEILNIHRTQPNQANSIGEEGTNRWYLLISQHSNKKNDVSCCGTEHFLLGKSYEETPPAKTSNKHVIKNRYQFQSYLWAWVEHSRGLIKNYTTIKDDSRIKNLNKTKVKIQSLKDDILKYSQESSYAFVQEIYQRLHDDIPNKEFMGKHELLVNLSNTLLEIGNESLDKLKKEKQKLISCKELKKIKNIRHLYDILDIESSDKAKKDYEIKSALMYLIEKHVS